MNEWRPRGGGTGDGMWLREWFENWTVQMRKGVLDMCILKALSEGEWYGYALVKALVSIPGVGVAEGSIYPLLSRLRRQGLVTTRLEESREGPARKYYSLTAEGRMLAREMEVYFREMQRGFAGLRADGFPAAGVREAVQEPSDELTT